MSISAAVATLDDLYALDSKAELIAGRIVHLMATGHWPNIVAGRIFRRLADYADATGRGIAYTDNMGFAIAELANGRQSFSPDAAYYTGPLPARRMRFVTAAPDFAVEVRSEGDYGPAADEEIAAKRADYFEAGTVVVWDVDPEAGTVTRFVVGDPSPTRFGAGSEVDAEPALPGWRLAVDWLMGEVPS